MRGQAYPIPIPDGGVDYSHPPHQIQPNQLSDGMNMFLDGDGLYKPRSGYMPLATPGPNAQILGGVNYADVSGAYQTVVATATDWWALRAGAWVKITSPAVPLTGSLNDLVRFTVWSQGGVWYAIAVNNTNPLHIAASAAMATVPPGAPIARDVLVLGSRVVVFNTVETSVRYARRARWSSFEDINTWGTLNFNDMLDSSDFIVGARKTGRNAAAVYGGQSIWTIQLNSGGDDASAFTTEEIFTAENYSGPIGTAAIIVAEGAHYYLGTDTRIYVFDGIQPISMGDPISPKIRALLNLGGGMRCHGVYLPQTRGLMFFFPVTGSGSNCRAAAYFDLRRAVWEPLMIFSEDITASWQGTFETAMTWDQSTITWDQSTLTWDAKADALQLGVFIGTGAGQVHSFWQGFADAGMAIPYSAYGPLFTPDISRSIALDRAEMYMRQPAQQEFVTWQFDGFGAPFEPSTPIVSFGVDISANAWTNMMIEPGPNNPNNQMTNFLRLGLISSQSQGGMAFGGGVMYLMSENKGDYSVLRTSS